MAGLFNRICLLDFGLTQWNRSAKCCACGILQQLCSESCVNHVDLHTLLQTHTTGFNVSFVCVCVCVVVVYVCCACVVCVCALNDRLRKYCLRTFDHDDVLFSILSAVRRVRKSYIVIQRGTILETC